MSSDRSPKRPSIDDLARELESAHLSIRTLEKTLAEGEQQGGQQGGQQGQQGGGQQGGGANQNGFSGGGSRAFGPGSLTPADIRQFRREASELHCKLGDRTEEARVS